MTFASHATANDYDGPVWQAGEDDWSAPFVIGKTPQAALPAEDNSDPGDPEPTAHEEPAETVAVTEGQETEQTPAEETAQETEGQPADTETQEIAVPEATAEAPAQETQGTKEEELEVESVRVKRGGWYEVLFVDGTEKKMRLDDLPRAARKMVDPND